jgi:drug/metabolite transporter (DMT)-like permease
VNGRVALLTAAALTGFAANSLLCRMALRPALVDAATFTGVRLLSGAVVLALLARFAARGTGGVRGSWASAAALFAYAAAFSYAYLRISAGVGALLLFGAVQITMLAAALRAGERPGGLEAAGWLAAAGGLVALLSPGMTAPDPRGAALMAAAGVAWGLYSLRGRAAASPLAATADNFARSVPMAAALVVLALAWTRLHASARGIALAVLSGALASGVGYSFWYAAVPTLGATRAAVVQLLVPVLVAAAGVVLLGEPVTRRLVVCALAVLGGVALATSAGRRGRRSGPR